MTNDHELPGPEPVTAPAPAGEEGRRRYKSDLTGGTGGLSGSSYVVGGLDESYVDADGTPVHRFCRYAIPIRTVNRCDHREYVCARCAEVWMYDWEFYFDRTSGGRRLRADLGGEEALAAMAARRAAWENQATAVEVDADPDVTELVSPDGPACATAATG